jgi:hypothetical protein
MGIDITQLGKPWGLFDGYNFIARGDDGYNGLSVDRDVGLAKGSQHTHFLSTYAASREKYLLSPAQVFADLYDML